MLTSFSEYVGFIEDATRGESPPPLIYSRRFRMVWAALGARGGLFVRLFGSLWRGLGEFWAFFWDLGPLWGSLWRPLGDFWGALGWLWDTFGRLWGAFGLSFGSVGSLWGGARGRLLAPFGLHLGTLRG